MRSTTRPFRLPLLLSLLVGALVALALPATAGATPLVINGTVFYSGTSNTLAGSSIANAGDVNGDGATDVIVSSPHVSTALPLPNRVENGAAYVVFGPFGPHEVIGLDNLGTRGYRILGGSDLDIGKGHFGVSVAGIGDVNGDGRADLGAVAEKGGVLNTTSLKGYAVVILGGSSTANIDLRSPLGARGFHVALPDPYYAKQYLKIIPAGDVNGDGMADFAVSDPVFYNPNIGNVGTTCNQPTTECGRGDVYVIFGRHAVTDLNADTLGPGGYKISGAGNQHYLGVGLAAAGDVNGDGLGDLVIGEPQCLPAGSPCGGGSVFVLYGKASSSAIDLTLPLSVDRGFRIDGPAGGGMGTSVSVPGDINGDGRPDLVLGAPFADGAGRIGNGAAYVYFTPANPPAVTDIGAIGSPAALITGAASGDALGTAVSPAGDVDGDGLADFAVGAPHAGANTRGSVYVIRGLHQPATAVDTAALTSAQGYELRAWLPNMALGTALADLGDLNADGRDELLMGAPTGSPPGTSQGGYGVLQFDAPLPSLTTFPVQNLGDTGASLAANIFPSGQATTARVQFGAGGVLGAPGAPVDVGAGTAAVPVLLPLSGLAPVTTYTYRIVVANASGTVFGRTRSFTTLAAGTGPGPGPDPGPVVGDTKAPSVTISTPRCHRSRARCRHFTARRSSWRTLRGTVTDPVLSAGVRNVQVAAVRKRHRRCATLQTRGFRAGRCAAQPRWITARVSGGRWSLVVRRLPRGAVRLQVRAADNAGHTSPTRTRTLHLTR